MKRIFSKLLGYDILETLPIYRGANSRVFRVIDCEENSWCGKLYAAPGFGGHDRLDTEWCACNFLYKHNKFKVPRPVACSLQESAAIFDWIDGRRFTSQQIGPREVEEALSFLQWIDGLRDTPDAKLVTTASEACFSGSALLNNIADRINRLCLVQEEGPEYEAMRSFITLDLKPATDHFSQFAYKSYKNLLRNFDDEIPHEERIMSPSDFGFHNALNTCLGIVWLDFEFFGWDDPAKTMADFILHPAMNLSPAIRSRFWNGVATTFDKSGDLLERARILYPLYGITWCLIILNEFIRSDLERREFAGKEKSNKTDILRRQLNKSKRMLETIRNHHEKAAF